MAESNELRYSNNETYEIQYSLLYWNGQSACLWSKSDNGNGYDQAPETERISVFDESLTNLRMLKIQSTFQGNLKDLLGFGL